MNAATLNPVTRTRAATSCASPGNSLIDAHLREHIDPEVRHAMIAEAAYYIAEARGFGPGYDLIDWLAAEDQIDSALLLSDMQAEALIRDLRR